MQDRNPAAFSGADAAQLLLRDRERQQRLVLAGDAGRLELLVERTLLPPTIGAEDHVRLGGLDLVDRRGELDVAERVVVLADDLAADARELGRAILLVVRGQM